FWQRRISGGLIDRAMLPGLRPKTMPTSARGRSFGETGTLPGSVARRRSRPWPLSHHVSAQTGSSTRRRPRPQQGCRSEDRPVFCSAPFLLPLGFRPRRSWPSPPVRHPYTLPRVFLAPPASIQSFPLLLPPFPRRFPLHRRRGRVFALDPVA